MKYYIKKYEEPYEPLNKNYPNEVMEHWWQGDNKKFKEAVKNYDNYYGTILPEAEITASKTTPTKTSNWTSEHNITEDNKKYEQTHQAESQKIASAVNRKMHDVGSKIGLGMTAALGAGYLAPATMAGWSAFSAAHPLIAAGVDGALTAHGVYNLFGENGIQKTYNHFKNGEVGKGILSGAADALDVMGGASLLGKIYNLGKKVKYIKNLDEFYTGVPHKPLKEDPTKFMDVEAPKNNDYTLWSSDDLDYARMFATNYGSSEGTIYKVLIDKKLKLLDTPTPKEGEVYSWENLPFTYKKNGVVEQHPGYLMKTGIFKNKKSSLDRNTDYLYINDPKDSKQLLQSRGFEDVSDVLDPRKYLQKKLGYVPDTDNFVNSVSQEGKFQGVRFNKIFDGGVDIENKMHFYPINEVVLFKNTPRILIPENKSKWSLLFKNIKGYKQGGKLK